MTDAEIIAATEVAHSLAGILILVALAKVPKAIYDDRFFERRKYLALIT